MMLIRLLALCLVLFCALPARAEVARVTGGEHADFTRLVVEARSAGQWQFGRSSDGYELALGPDVAAFDVTDAFSKIPRDRITALWRDPDSGHLRFSLACACHAVAFEFRPGIVVIDIRSGPPPEGSMFETRLLEPPVDDQPGVALASAPTNGQSDVATYDWLDAARERTSPAARSELSLPTADVSLIPLRDALLAQISRGVAEGVIDVTKELPPVKPDAGNVEDVPWARIAIGEMPGLRVGSAADPTQTGTLTAEGQSCIPDKDLDVANWGLSGPVAAQIGLGRSGMLTEFDTPVPEAILRTVRLHIHLGFGAEARQYLQLLGSRRAGQAAVLEAMARIVDEEPVEGSPFDGQESCDSAAALWATLAHRGQPAAPLVNGEAVARSFSALPLHLRRYLGAPLVDAFLAAGDDSTARMIRDATMRVPADGLPEVELMDARYHLADGKDAAAGEIAAGVLADGGPAGAEAAVTLVEAAFRGTRQVDPKVPASLDAFLLDSRGTPQETQLLRAKVLAAAMATDYVTAFAALDRSPGTFADLWLLAADGSPDEIFLEQAAIRAANHPQVAEATSRRMAQRLTGLGFPDLALQWLGPVDTSSAEDLRVLAARARLTLRDAPAALALLAGINSSEAAEMRASATLQLGDMKAAAEMMIAAGEAEDGQRAMTWSQDWTLIGSEGPEGWRGPVTLVSPPALPAEAGPIARGTALADESAAAREMLGDLLLSVPSLPVDQ